MARYRKVDPRIWNDAKFMALSDDGKLLFLCLLTHPNLTVLGAMRGRPEVFGIELKWVGERVSTGFRELLRQRLVEYDETGGMVALPKFFNYNRPENPNVVKSWASAMDLLPECTLKNTVVARLARVTETLGQGFLKAFRQSFLECLANGMPNQEQEQEQEQESNTHLSLKDVARAGEDGGIDDPLGGLRLPIATPPQRPVDEASEAESAADPLSGGGVSPEAWEAQRGALVRPEVVLAAALHRSGLARVNNTHPALVNAVKAGVTPQELVDLAAEFPDKPATYLLKAATSRRLDAQGAPAVSPGGAVRSGGRPSVAEANRAALDQYLREEGIEPDPEPRALEHPHDDP